MPEGIGRAIALAYAELGATIYVLEISEDRASELRSLMSGNHVILKGDVSINEDIERTIAAIKEAYGKLDILVNKVGDSLRLRGPFESRIEGDWDALYAINLKHIFSVTRASLLLIRATGKGDSIINMSTIEAYRGAPPAAIYAAFKAAITGFTKSIALELAPEGIRVNIITPEITESVQVPVSQMIASIASTYRAGSDGALWRSI